MTFSVYCACTSYKLLAKWRILSLTKRLQQQLHFTVKSASAYVSARGLNRPLIACQKLGQSDLTYFKVQNRQPKKVGVNRHLQAF